MPAKSTSFFSTKPHWLAHVDPRIKILLASLTGILTWKVSPLGVAVYGIFLWILIADAGLLSRTHRSLLRGYTSFILLWGLLLFGLECIAPNPNYEEAAYKALVFSGRLSVLIGIGLTLAIFSSPRQLGLALSWFLRPFLGKRSWQTALSLALMIHFLPLIQQTFSQVKQSIVLRNPPIGKWRRFLIIPQAVLRILAQKTWTQTIAIAARGLDRPEAWIPYFPAQPRVWLAGSIYAMGALSVLWL